MAGILPPATLTLHHCSIGQWETKNKNKDHHLGNDVTSLLGKTWNQFHAALMIRNSMVVSKSFQLFLEQHDITFVPPPTRSGVMPLG